MFLQPKKPVVVALKNNRRLHIQFSRKSQFLLATQDDVHDVRCNTFEQLAISVESLSSWSNNVLLPLDHQKCIYFERSGAYSVFWELFILMFFINLICTQAIIRIYVNVGQVYSV
ncbi:hypothetical protein AQUCO_07100017v1 [Aquilegia coerulea]|uniref:Uncharacterized protein n=1 Tax=Aquilegia coerulea TaxID=218851 RepID=A0A2G5CAQ5_AQUCA|nr:hypothetical protein AQUCO_07100017v1 [Aquilegia coerulea]